LWAPASGAAQIEAGMELWEGVLLLPVAQDEFGMMEVDALFGSGKKITLSS